MFLVDGITEGKAKYPTKVIYLSPPVYSYLGKGPTSLPPSFIMPDGLLLENRHNVFTCLNLTDRITPLWDNHRQSVKNTPCSRGHNYKSATVWSLIQTFLLLFSPPNATACSEQTTNWLRSNLKVPSNHMFGPI